MPSLSHFRLFFCRLLLGAWLLPLHFAHGQTLAAASPGDTGAAQSTATPEPFSQPLFPGGPAALSSFLKDNLRYPVEASDQHISGKVLVTFWVDEEGRTYGHGAVQSPHNSLTQEALRVAKRMPTWTPGRQDGKIVPMMVYLPITFRLMDQP